MKPTTPRSPHIHLLVCLLMGLLGVPAFAGYIQGVTVPAVSLQWYNINTSNPDRRAGSNLVNDTGIFGSQVTTFPGGTMWLAANPAGTTGANLSTAGTNWIVFDLGSVHTVNAMKVWNYNENNAAGTQTTGTNQGVKLAHISYSSDGINYTTNLPGYQFDVAPGTYSSFAQTIDMGAISARYVRLDILTNWHTTANRPVGLSKVRFIDNSVPPLLKSATQNYSSNQVTVIFSEPVDPQSATNKANYALQGTGTAPVILEASMGQFDDRVVLKTSTLAGQAYTLVASGVYDQARVITITNNSQVTVSRELVLWLRADAGINTDELGNVTQWNDQSGYNHHALTNLAVNQYFAPPTLAPGTLNGLPTVSFDGTQLMNIPHDANLAINGDMTLCIVINKATSAAAGPISKTGGQTAAYVTPAPLTGYTNNMPSPFDLQLTAAQRPSFVWGNPTSGSGGLTAFAGPVLSLNQYYILTLSVRGTNLSCLLNGAQAASTMTKVAPADAGNPIMLGVRLDSGNPRSAGVQFNGNMAEVMLLRGTATPGDLSAMNQYLGAKYGIPITTLAITETPQNATAQVGKTATFWVNAIGVPPLSYQWKSNNVNIAGATSPVYTTPPLSAAANGASYTVTVASPVGTTNSIPVTLTVSADNTAPAVNSVVRGTAANTLVVAYSEAVNAGATNPASYTLNSGAAVLAAAYGNSASNQVILTTSQLDPATGCFLRVQNVQDLYGNLIAAGSQPVLPEGLAIYLRADSGIVLDNANLVSQWRDLTTNANHAAQFAAGPTSRPSATTATVNGLPAITFQAASSNYLQVPHNPSLAINGDISLYVVANVADLAAPREFLGKTLRNQPASYDYYIRPDHSVTYLYRGNGATSAGFGGGLPTTGVPHVFSVTQAGTNVNHYLDGAPKGSGSLSTAMADSNTDLRIGTRDDLAQFMNGEIAEIMVYRGALSAADRIAIDNYLGHHYFQLNFTRQPASIVTNQGIAVSFSVAATQGSAHLSYQWRKNNVEIPGATNDIYTTPMLAPADNGASFDVLVSIPGLSTNVSSPAVLTVNTVPPVLTSVGRAIWSGTNLVLVFSQAVDPATATFVGNYTLDNGATVLSAVMGDTPNKVVLTTSPLTSGTAYNLTAQQVKDLFNNTMVTATLPLGLYPTGAALWLRADSGVTFDAGSGMVWQWDDQSGSGNNMFAGIAPLLVTNVLNGKPVIRFDGVSSYMSANSTPSLAITGDMTIVSVVMFSNLTANGSSGMIASKTSGNKPAPFDYYVRSGRVELYRGDGTAYGLAFGTSVPTVQVPHVMAAVMQGISVAHRLDGLFNGSGIISATIADTGSPLFIGSREDNANRLNGDLAELIIFSSALSTNDLAAMETYLGAKYHLPIGTPEPLSISSLGGGQLRLTWGFGTLQKADAVSGPYQDLANAVSPYVVQTTNTAQFYRVREQ